MKLKAMWEEEGNAHFDHHLVIFPQSLQKSSATKVSNIVHIREWYDQFAVFLDSKIIASEKNVKKQTFDVAEDMKPFSTYRRFLTPL